MANKSDSIFTSRKNANVSNMVTAMKGWNFKSEKPDGQFGRVVKITVGSVTIDNSFDIEFTVPFDDDTEPNEAEVKIYNLTRKTVGYLRPDSVLSISAGYGDDVGVIFVGVISNVKTRWSGEDRVTTINAIDCENLKDRDIDSLAFKEGVKASYILKKLVSMLGLPIACFKIRRDHTYTEAVTVSGGLHSAIEQYAEVCGVSAYINKRMVYVRHLKDGDDLGFTVDSDTGLIGNPEEFTEEVNDENYQGTIDGIRFKMLLEHRITTASIIRMKSRDFNGSYRVREGEHVCTDSDFYTEVTAIE